MSNDQFWCGSVLLCHRSLSAYVIEERDTEGHEVRKDRCFPTDWIEQMMPFLYNVIIPY